MKILKNKEKRRSDYASYGTDGHINVFTGEFQKPTIVNWDKGGRNINTDQKGDTDAFTQSLSELKSKLCEYLPQTIPSTLLNEKDIINVHLIEKWKQSEEIQNFEIKWFPIAAIEKLLLHYNITEVDV